MKNSLSAAYAGGVVLTASQIAAAVLGDHLNVAVAVAIAGVPIGRRVRSAVAAGTDAPTATYTVISVGLLISVALVDINASALLGAGFLSGLLPTLFWGRR
uniref:hypothetical protein n=1 Tax=Actinomadura sp. CA-154981 TaxID=3240037 RepID=UPI003F4964B2